MCEPSGEEKDFAEESREAFGHLTDDLLRIDVNEPGMRLVNTSRRVALLKRIDDRLDDYNVWMEIARASDRLSP